MAGFVTALHTQVVPAANQAVAPAQQAGMALNTLKQFRDVFDMRVAAYAALVAARATRTNVRDLVYYDGAKIALEVMWSDTSSEALIPTCAGPDLRGGFPRG